MRPADSLLAPASHLRGGFVRLVSGLRTAGGGVARAARSLGSWRRELTIALAAYGVYAIVKSAFAGTRAEGLDRAQGVIDLERTLGILVEADIQRAFVENSLAMPFWNWFYLASQVLVLPLTLMLVFRFARHAYPLLRNLAILSWTGGVFWYALQPVVPPRHADIGIVDTISTQTAFDLDGGFALFFYNPVAAMPSLHVGMAPVAAWALWRLTPWLVTRTAGLVYPVVVALTVVVTGNHYLLDIVGGLALVVVAALVARVVTGPVVAPEGAPPPDGRQPAGGSTA